uniref:Uncharacterized protein n=1 Tax=Corethron hystrix TaxID=216773 RepID=A0A6U5JBX0_9STRA|mmetsp:Transcript_36699/g.85757  ORF Transcript_36699/g.85757 Transcript_36699/m.85757 type:complete len:150 (+) Transcript_36699:298-747(+)
MGNQESALKENLGGAQEETESRFNVTVSSDLLDDLKNETEEAVQAQSTDNAFEEWRMRNASQLEYLDGEMSSLIGKLTDGITEISYDLKNIEHSFSKSDHLLDRTEKKNLCLHLQRELRNCYTSKDAKSDCSLLSKALAQCVADSIVHS